MVQKTQKIEVNCLIVYGKNQSEHFFESVVKQNVINTGGTPKLVAVNQIAQSNKEYIEQYNDVLNSDIIIIDGTCEVNYIINFLKASHFLERETILFYSQNETINPFLLSNAVLFVPYLYKDVKSIQIYHELKKEHAQKGFKYKERKNFLYKIPFSFVNFNEVAFKLQQYLLMLMHTEVLVELTEYDKEDDFKYIYEINRLLANHIHTYYKTAQFSRKIKLILENARSAYNNEAYYKMNEALDTINEEQRGWLALKAIKAIGKEKKESITYNYSYPLY